MKLTQSPRFSCTFSSVVLWYSFSWSRLSSFGMWTWNLMFIHLNNTDSLMGFVHTNTLLDCDTDTLLLFHTQQESEKDWKDSDQKLGSMEGYNIYHSINCVITCAILSVSASPLLSLSRTERSHQLYFWRHLNLLQVVQQWRWNSWRMQRGRPPCCRQGNDLCRTWVQTDQTKL